MPTPFARAIVLRSLERSVRTGLAGVFAAGTLPGGGGVLACDHGSWWDGYVLVSLIRRSGQTAAVMMTERQLAAFPFLASAGAHPPTALRTLADQAAAGAWVIVFPEGEIQPPGSGLSSFHGGAAWLAHTARVPLVPAAAAVVLRGGPQPEAYLRLGAPLPARADEQSTRDAVARITEILTTAVGTERAALRADLAAADPDGSVPGYRAVVRGTARRRDTPDLSSRMLTALTRPVYR